MCCCSSDIQCEQCCILCSFFTPFLILIFGPLITLSVFDFLTYEMSDVCNVSNWFLASGILIVLLCSFFVFTILLLICQIGSLVMVNVYLAMFSGISLNCTLFAFGIKSAIVIFNNSACTNSFTELQYRMLMAHFIIFCLIVVDYFCNKPKKSNNNNRHANSDDDSIKLLHIFMPGYLKPLFSKFKFERHPETLQRSVSVHKLPESLKMIEPQQTEPISIQTQPTQQTESIPTQQTESIPISTQQTESMPQYQCNNANANVQIVHSNI
jgi:hypothetical protein